MRWACLLLICFFSHAVATEKLLRVTLIEKNTVCFHLSADFSRRYVRQSLRLSYPQEIDLKNLPQSIVNIPLITNVIAVIWLSGKTYSIEEMDEDLYFSLIKIKTFFKRFFYNTSWEGELKPERLVKNTPPVIYARAAALFTGGLDSTTTALRHFDEHLMLISFNEAHQHAVEFAKTHGFDFYSIYMNYDDFLKLTLLDKVSIDITKWFWDTSMGLSWVGAAAPFLYAKGIPTLYIPSGLTWQSFMFPDGQTLRQPASPLIDENLSPAGLEVRHDVFTMTRTDKIQFISTFCSSKNISKPRLVVCNNHKRSDTSYTHCNSCMKCYITMLDILAIGEDIQEYGFTISAQEFIIRFKAYIETLTMRRGGTYVACHDTQCYLKQHLEKLPTTYRSFYDWFLSIDLWARVDQASSRPPRLVPFHWRDYQDLYPGVHEFLEDYN